MGKSRRFFKTAVEELSLEETELFRSSAEITSFNEVADVCPHQKSCFLQVFLLKPFLFKKIFWKVKCEMSQQLQQVFMK